MTDNSLQHQLPIQLGIVGFGAAARGFLPAIASRSHWKLSAIAENNALVRSQINLSDVKIYDDIDDLLNDRAIQAVYIATPTPLHFEQVIKALKAEKHVLVEKPLATNMVEALQMRELAQVSGKILLIGHSHSYDLPIQKMHELIRSQQLGDIKMVNTWCFTDWMTRPRRQEELDLTLGGSALFRQGAHQFDVVRLLCGGQAKTVRAQTFDWHPTRKSIGAHTAFIEFENGAVATAIYNGYGGLTTMDLGFPITEWGQSYDPNQYLSNKKDALKLSPAEELLKKQQRALTAIPENPSYQAFFGLTIVSCEKGDIRQSPNGLIIDTIQGREEILLDPNLTPRQLVLDEWEAAILDVKKPLHDISWAIANLEICEACIESSKQKMEIKLLYQTPC